MRPTFYHYFINDTPGALRARVGILLLITSEFSTKSLGGYGSSFCDIVDSDEDFADIGSIYQSKWNMSGSLKYHGVLFDERIIRTLEVSAKGDC